MTFLSIREWDELSISENSLSVCEVDRFQALAERAARLLKLPDSAVLTRTSRGLKAQQIVGILVIPGHTLEILPKIDSEDETVRQSFIRMLAVAYDLRIVEGELSSLGIQQYGLLEILIRLFASRLMSAVRQGLPRRYVTHEEDLPLLRGRLNVVRQFSNLAGQPNRLACRFDELSEDTPLNRVLKAVVMRLALLTRSTANARLLSEITARFELTGDSPRPLDEAVILDRTNSAFHDLYRLARIFLSGQWQNTVSGDSLGFTLLFPMNELFEKYIGRSLQRAMFPQPIELQRGGRYALEKENGKGIFALKPDIVILSDSRTIILDTKWKWLDRTRRNLGVKQGDVYQMLAYGRSWNATSVILVYPWHKSIGKDSGGVCRWIAMEPKRFSLDIATVDVGNPEMVEETLSRIVSFGKSDLETMPELASTGPSTRWAITHNGEN